MSNEFSKTSDMLETCLSKLDAADEFEFHYSSVSGAEVTSRFEKVENIQYHDDNSLTVTCISQKKRNC